jgi:hypothetical protein
MMSSRSLAPRSLDPRRFAPGLVACLLVPSTLATAGCDVFDRSLYMGAADGGNSDLVQLADRCNAAPPLVESRSTEFTVDTTALTNRVSDVSSCAGRSAPGNDGFFAVDMMAGERWHFHVKSLASDGDPLLYILGTGCDERTCQPGDASNECGAQDEHLSYRAPATGRYTVGVDDANPRGGRYTVLAIRPTCNGVALEHSEACDDDNETCTDDCYRIVGDGEGEREPNSQPLDANILEIGAGGSATVTGDIGSECDLASFRVTVPEGGGAIGASLLPRGQAACTPTAPPAFLELVDRNMRTTLGHGGSPAIGTCPLIDEAVQAFAQDLAAGDYFLRLSAPGFAETTPYPFSLTVRVAPAMP